MWTIYDYPTYGPVSKWVHQGYKAYATCELYITSRCFGKLGKVVYEGFSHWLARNHPYRINWSLAHFNKKEHMSKPCPITTS
jgi:hypothetical protein